jgi:hypothetical protein
MILGGDGQQYGPVTANEFLAWVREGRANGQTQVMRSDSSEWRAAQTFSELNLVAAPPVSALPAAPARNELELDQRLRSGASWFYWVAALSLINSLLIVSNQPWGFAIGLGITRETDHALPRVMAFAFSLVASGIMAMFGFFAIKRHTWAFTVGMVLLVLDTGLTVLQQAWISVAFHAWALVSIFMAFQACRALRRS